MILETLTRDVELLRHGMATREVVEASIAALASQLSSTERSLKSAMNTQKSDLQRKLDDVKDDHDRQWNEDVVPIKKGINRLVWLIITALVGVLLAIAFNGVPKIP